jgi:hypothetical protein
VSGLIFHDGIQMARKSRRTRRRRGGDIYTEKKQERSAEIQELEKSGVAKELIERYKKERALLHGGRRRRKMTRRNK